MRGELNLIAIVSRLGARQEKRVGVEYPLPRIPGGEVEPESAISRASGHCGCEIAARAVVEQPKMLGRNGNRSDPSVFPDSGDFIDDAPGNPSGKRAGVVDGVAGAGGCYRNRHHGRNLVVAVIARARINGFLGKVYARRVSLIRARFKGVFLQRIRRVLWVHGDILLGEKGKGSAGLEASTTPPLRETKQRWNQYDGMYFLLVPSKVKHSFLFTTAVDASAMLLVAVVTQVASGIVQNGAP